MGFDGVVYASPKSMTAAKIHARVEGFGRKLAVYRRLANRQASEFMGFHIPRLMNFCERRLILEMSIVHPPFLLDFAATTIDKPPDFTEDAMADWWQRVDENFGDGFDTARDIFVALKRPLGLYYRDRRPLNLRFR